MTTDVSQVYRIKRSVGRQIALSVGSILFVLVGWWMTNDPAFASKHPYAPFIGWVCVVFFGVCGVGWAYRVAFGDSWPVTLSPEGMTDLRISRSLVPWHAVKNIETKRIGSVSLLGIDFDQSLRLELSPFGRIVAATNSALYGCRYWLVSTDLNLSFARLHDLVQAYWRAHGSPRTPNGLVPTSATKGA